MNRARERFRRDGSVVLLISAVIDICFSEEALRCGLVERFTNFRVLLQGKVQSSIAAFKIFQRHLHELLALPPVLRQQPTFSQLLLSDAHKNHRTTSRLLRVDLHSSRKAKFVCETKILIDVKLRHERSSVVAQVSKTAVLYKTTSHEVMCMLEWYGHCALKDLGKLRVLPL
jgi:hypothetical protein